MASIPLDRARFRGEGFEELLAPAEQMLSRKAPDNRWIEAMVRAASALYYAHAGRGDEALRAIAAVLPAIDRAPGWAANYTATAWLAIESLWILGRADFADVLERNLREKTLAPDFRHVQTDARLALARLCALTGRLVEARSWFDEARRVLEEQGARPLRAIVDLDEAWMEVRRRQSADHARARTLLDAARGSFQSLGMPGWLRRADALHLELACIDDTRIDTTRIASALREHEGK
jgi:hypothetical protein